MDDDFDLRHFSGITRLFPLPGVVLFPHAILPLHIFEPRYRQMTADALAGDKFITIVQLRSPSIGTGATLGSPPIETVGCLGRIIQHERLPDGRFNFLLLGRKRVRLLHETIEEKLYRSAVVEILDDVIETKPDEPRRAELNALFRTAFERRHKLDADLASILDSAIPLSVLTDIVGHALGLPPEVKQTLLVETHVDRRTEALLSILRQILSPENESSDLGPSFPPPFSMN